MPPGKALELPADGQCPGVEIDVLPPESERLALPEPQGQGDAPPGTITPRCSQPADAQRFIEGQWLNLIVAGRRGVNKSGDIAGNVSALHGNLERPGQKWSRDHLHTICTRSASTLHIRELQCCVARAKARRESMAGAGDFPGASKAMA